MCPTSSFTGLDTVVVSACDQSGLCSQGTVTVIVTPIARDDTASTFSGVPVVADIRANDTGDTGTCRHRRPPPPARGIGRDPSRRDAALHTSSPTRWGSSGCSTRCARTNVTDGMRCRELSIVFISPLAVPDSAVTDANQSVLIDAGANDLGDANLIVVSTPPQHGTVVNEGSGLFTYTPASGFTGIDVFEYDRCDATSRLCTSAAVTVTVLPSVFDDKATTVESVPVQIFVLANDVGAFANPHINDTPSNGSAVVVGDHVVYTPYVGFVGEDVFTYSSCSPLRITFCSSAFVRVTVVAAEPPPTHHDHPRPCLPTHPPADVCRRHHVVDSGSTGRHRRADRCSNRIRHRGVRARHRADRAARRPRAR